MRDPEDRPSIYQTTKPLETEEDSFVENDYQNMQGSLFNIYDEPNQLQVSLNDNRNDIWQKDKVSH